MLIKSKLQIATIQKGKHTPDRMSNSTLIVASGHGQIDIVQEQLSAGARVDAQQGKALSVASLFGHLHVVRALLSAGGVDLHTDVNRALSFACLCGHFEIARELLLMGAGADVRANDDQALAFACLNGRSDIVRTLLGAGADAHSQWGRALTLASLGGHLDAVRALLEIAANPSDLVHANDDKALAYACFGGHVDVVRVLLEAGADVNAAKGLPLYVASADDGHVHVVRALLEAGAYVDAECFGSSVTSQAAWDGHYAVVRTLRDTRWQMLEMYEPGLALPSFARHYKTADKLMNTRNCVKNERKGNALIRASMSGNVDVVRVLLEAGARATAHDNLSLRLASKFGRVDVVRVLLDAGARADGGCWGEVLSRNCVSGRVDIVRLLLDAGAAADADGCSEALCRASEFGRVDIVRLLLAAGTYVHTYGNAALREAQRNGHQNVVQELTAGGASMDALDVRENMVFVVEPRNYTGLPDFPQCYMTRRPKSSRVKSFTLEPLPFQVVRVEHENACVDASPNSMPSPTSVLTIVPLPDRHGNREVCKSKSKVMRVPKDAQLHPVPSKKAKALDTRFVYHAAHTWSSGVFDYRLLLCEDPSMPMRFHINNFQFDDNGCHGGCHITYTKQLYDEKYAVGNIV